MLFRGGSVIRLQPGGMVVGMFEDVHYQKDALALHSDDTLVIYSDGITEAINPAEEEYGEERLIDLVRDNQQANAEQLRDLIFADVTQFAGEAPQSDDMTVVIVKVRKTL
jgi:sigma-B regulation protein RsbU (phosphoserine phosphatase)